MKVLELTKDTDLEALATGELDQLYFKVFGRRAFHLSKDGYIYYLENIREQYIQKQLTKN